MARGAFLLVGSPHYDLERGRQMIQQGLALSRKLGNQSVEAKALWRVMLQAIYAEN